jgi:hypothetical protein
VSLKMQPDKTYAPSTTSGSQTVRWVSFCISNTLTHSIIHFFPSEGSVTAPYQASCQLTLFGEHCVEKRVLLEGARLSCPDGVRIEDAFPIVADEGNGLFGLYVEVSTLQPRVDLSGSSVVIELQSRGNAAKFWPRTLSQANAASVQATAPAFKDPFTSTSVMAVNGAQVERRAELFARSLITPGADEAISLGIVPAHGVSEMPLPVNFFEGVDPVEFEWGLSRARGVYRQAALPPDLAYFLVYRDAASRRVVSVHAL